MLKNKLRVSLLVSALLLAALAPAAFASGTSYSTPAQPIGAQQDPLLVTKSIKVRVLEVGPDGQFFIQDSKNEQSGWIKVTDDTRVRAQDRKAFDGRKKLELSDLAVGQLLRISHRPATGEVLKIKVLRDKKS